MADKITIPDIGTTVDRVTLVNRLKNEGDDPVKRGDGICEVETGKAVSELESIAEGILLKQVVPAVTIVGAGIPIATGLGLVFKMKKGKRMAALTCRRPSRRQWKNFTFLARTG